MNEKTIKTVVNVVKTVVQELVKLKAKIIDVEAGLNVALLNEKYAEQIDFDVSDRAKLTLGRKSLVAIIDHSKKMVRPGEIGLFADVAAALGARNGRLIETDLASRPSSLDYIHKKLDGGTLAEHEIRAVIDDLMAERLSSAESAVFISGVYTKGLNTDETIFLTKAILATGGVLKPKRKPVVSEHSVHADTPVLIEEKKTRKIVRIGSFIDEFMEKHRAAKQSCGDGEYLEINSRDYRVLTFDDELNVAYQPLTGVYRHPSPKKLFRITLLGNREVTVTDRHSVFCLREGRVVPTTVNAIKVGDYLAAPRKTPSPSGVARIDLVKAFSKLDRHETSDICITGITNQFKKEMSWEERAYDLVPLETYLRKPARLPEKSRLKIKRARYGIPTKLAVSKELMRLLGYYVAEGFVSAEKLHFSFGAHERELIEDVKTCFKKVFGLDIPERKAHPTAVHVVIESRLLCRLFTSVFTAGSCSFEKRVPEIVFNSNPRLQLEFLKAYTRGDGYVRRGYEAILVTNSKELATGLCYLLGLNGISHSIYKRKAETRTFPQGYTSQTREAHFIYTNAYKIFGGGTRSSSYIDFLPLLPSGLKNAVLANRAIGWAERGLVKQREHVHYERAGALLQLLKQNGSSVDAQFSDLAKGEVGFLPVKKIEEIESDCEYVYDFCVKGFEKFVGGTSPIFLHNSIGGVAGDRSSMLVVPIIASLGLTIPKTATRAISSACGSADAMEIFAPVDLNIAQAERVVNETGGCLIWGGAVNIAAADDRLIKIRNPLHLDPKPLLLASILAKKKAEGARFVALDIPVGRGAKIQNVDEARELATDFEALGKHLKMDVSCLISDGSEPLMNCVGPALEARSVLEILGGKNTSQLIEKACVLSGMLLSAVKSISRQEGYKMAKQQVNSGKALEKFREIIEAQGGNPDVQASDVRLANHSRKVYVKENGVVSHVDNKTLSRVARILGAPSDKEAGIEFFVSKNTRVKNKQHVATLYSDSKEKIDHAFEQIKKTPVIEIEKLVFDVV